MANRNDFDINRLNADWDVPNDPLNPSITMADLEKPLWQPELMPSGWTTQHQGGKHWDVTNPSGHTVRVTTDAQAYEHADGRLQWWQGPPHMRELLNNEPHVRGLGYNQYADELDDDYATPPLDQETFEKLADEWERDRPRGVDIAQMTRHLAYQRIIAMGEPAVPWLLHRLATKPDHWFVALSAITGAKPVPPESRGRVKEMVQAWLDWGSQQGYELETTNVD